MIVNGVGEGLPCSAPSIGDRERPGPIKKVVSAATFVGVCFGLLFMVVTIVAPRQVLLLLTNEEAVIQEGMVYLSVMSYSYVIFCLTTVLLAAMRSIQNVKIGTIISLSTLLINVALNYCLIFGRLGFPRLGTQGAGHRHAGGPHRGAWHHGGVCALRGEEAAHAHPGLLPL